MDTAFMTSENTYSFNLFMFFIGFPSRYIALVGVNHKN